MNRTLPDFDQSPTTFSGLAWAFVTLSPPSPYATSYSFSSSSSWYPSSNILLLLLISTSPPYLLQPASPPKTEIEPVHQIRQFFGSANFYCQTGDKVEMMGSIQKFH